MQVSQKKVFIGGNWKCNGDIKFIKELCQHLNTFEFETSRVEVAVCPTSLHIQTVLENLSNNFIVSAQNVSRFADGAYTGEISTKMLVDIGIKWTLLGHSERRQYFHEDETVLSEKLSQSIKSGLNVIYCVGKSSLIEKPAKLWI